MKLVIASDHAGVSLKADLAKRARELGHELIDLGPADTTSVDYPDFALKVAQAVSSGAAERGVLVCGTGIGMSITANKVHGVRAALCHTEYEAKMARAHNDANVVCLGQRVTGSGLAGAIVEAFVGESFEGGRHQGRVDKMSALEGNR